LPSTGLEELMKATSNVYNFIPYRPDKDNPGAETYPGDRYPHAGSIGGGNGTGLIRPSNACVVLDSLKANRSPLDQFVDCIGNASDGDRIWIENDVIVDLTNFTDFPLTIKNDIIIMSGRNKDTPGGKIKLGVVSDRDRPVILIERANVRFSGIRIYGNSREFSREDRTRGIRIEGDDAGDYVLVVDNSELNYWGRSAIHIRNAYGIIHHNTFENNKAGLGYGVGVSDGGKAIVEANVFYNNRHAIAGTGVPGDAYVAGWNVVKQPSARSDAPADTSVLAFPSHDFDMHGGVDRRDDTNIAGDYVNIYNNTFYNDFRPMRRNIHMRGKSLQESFIRYNKFAYPNPENAIRQSYEFGNLSIQGNKYVANNNGWSVSFTSNGSAGSWYRIATENIHPGEIALVNIKGLRNDQIFHADGSQWKISELLTESGGGALYVSWDEKINWEILESNSTRLEDMGFGDFNGDGYTDILIESDGNWHIRWSRTGEWSENWNTGKPPVRDVRFGDFDGNGITDVFYAEVQIENDIEYIFWNISRGARSPWEPINSWEMESEDGQKASIRNLAFGNFIDNGKTDVFAAWDRKWWINGGGADDFDLLNISPTGIDDLILADFNGNGFTDIFASWGGQWRVRWGGELSWTLFGESNLTIPNLNFGDINGNGVTDVIGRLSAQ